MDEAAARSLAAELVNERGCLMLAGERAARIGETFPHWFLRGVRINSPIGMMGEATFEEYQTQTDWLDERCPTGAHRFGPSDHFYVVSVD
jgi:hypothetical protein